MIHLRITYRKVYETSRNFFRGIHDTVHDPILKGPPSIVKMWDSDQMNRVATPPVLSVQTHTDLSSVSSAWFSHSKWFPCSQRTQRAQFPRRPTLHKHWYPLCNPECINIPDARGSSGSRGSRLVSGGVGSHQQADVAHQQKHSKQSKMQYC